ncbi:hypothetical protein R69927_05980 [Paraburkholderia domus]|nr:hypothetical protein R69927_05980 [Paraburkholderia domus]
MRKYCCIRNFCRPGLATSIKWDRHAPNFLAHSDHVTFTRMVCALLAKMIDGQLIEAFCMLDLRPVTALAENVQLRLWNQLEQPE